MNKKVFLIALAGSLGWLGIAGARGWQDRAGVEVRAKPVDTSAAENTDTNTSNTGTTANSEASTSNTNTGGSKPGENTDGSGNSSSGTSNTTGGSTPGENTGGSGNSSSGTSNTTTGGSTTGENTGGSGNSSSGTSNATSGNSSGSGSAPAETLVGYGPGKICPTGGGASSEPTQWGFYNLSTGKEDPSPLIRCPCGWRRAPYANYCINGLNANETCCPGVGCQIATTPCSQIDPRL